MSYRHLRRLLFALEAERAHSLGIWALRVLGSIAPAARFLRRSLQAGDPRLEQTIWGTKFSNPVGLAAGFDKEGAALEGLAALGFGFLEVGTVTPRAQEGNPRPRLWRHPELRSLQNAMGFNNKGMERLAQRLTGQPQRLPLGINIGKNRSTPLEKASEDYGELFAGLAGLGNYFVINISSPNTPGLRDLQEEKQLRTLIAARKHSAGEPVLVKLSPDMEPTAAATLARQAVEAGADGLILTNTTIAYELVPQAAGVGGLSGEVLRPQSREILRAVADEVFGDCLLISSGGIDSGEEAYRRLRAGASLVQVYTSLVYSGPLLVSRMQSELLTCLDRDGLESIGEAIGADCGR